MTDVDERYLRALDHHRAGRPREAEEACRHVISVQPDFAEGHNLLGSALQDQGRLREAESAYRHAIKLSPSVVAVLNNLGAVLGLQGRAEEAVVEFRLALALDPSFVDAWNNMGIALEDQLKQGEAADAYRQALRLRPDSAEAAFNLGNVLRDMVNPDGAIEAYSRAIALRPDYAEAINNLASVLRDTGRLGEALEMLRRLLARHRDPFIEGNYISSLYLHPNLDAKQIYQAHVQWNERYAKPLTTQRPDLPNRRDPNRRLRLAYVSPDLRQHPVARFLLPLLVHHDHVQFEIFCYTDLRHTDGLTRRLRERTDVWRGTLGLSDEQLAQQIREDQIDILIDLTMHTKGSRMLTFARKPAPVQVTYLAFCGTTGLQTMDYRLTDPYLDRLGCDESVYSETSIRLPRTYWCYEPPPDTPPVGNSPLVSNGFITFGCLNSFHKINPRTLEMWAAILRAVPRSKLLLVADEGSHRRRVCDLLESNQVDPRRLEFICRLPLLDYLSHHQHIDIALDPFPFPGGTTTCDALWMGVAVVSLTGKTAVSRGGLSILSNVGLRELVADTTGGYIQIASDLASDPSRLIELRNSLRQRMKASPLMNAAQFARDVEAAFRQMWNKWCESVSPGAGT